MNSKIYFKSRECWRAISEFLLHAYFTSRNRVHPETQALAFVQPTRANIHQYQFNSPIISFRSQNHNLIPYCPRKYKDYAKGKTVYVAAYCCGLDTARRIKPLIHPG